jgi:hypothetical protein
MSPRASSRLLVADGQVGHLAPAPTGLALDHFGLNEGPPHVAGRAVTAFLRAAGLRHSHRRRTAPRSVMLACHDAISAGMGAARSTRPIATRPG